MFIFFVLVYDILLFHFLNSFVFVSCIVVPPSGDVPGEMRVTTVDAGVGDFEVGESSYVDPSQQVCHCS